MGIDQVDQFEIEKLLNILRRKKWLIIISLLIIITPVLIYINTTTPVYRAQTVIVFEQHQGTAALLNPFQPTPTSSFITNQIEEIKSRSLAEEVVRSLPPGIINTFPLPKDKNPLFDKDSYLAAQIQKSTSAQTVPNSEIIKIKVEAYSPNDS